MNQKTQENKVIQAIDAIFKKGHKSQFSEEFRKSVEKESQIVCEYLGIDSSVQALLFSILFSMCIQKNSTIDVDDFSTYLNTSILKVFMYQKDFDELVKRKLIRRQKPHRRRRNNESLNYLSLYVPSDIPYNLINGLPLPKRRISNLNYFEVLTIVIEFFQNHDDGFIEADELFAEVDNVLQENRNLPFVKKLLSFGLPAIENIILLVVCQQFIEGYSAVELIRILKTLHSETQEQIKARKAWMLGNTKLQQKGVIRFDEDSQFRSDKAITLTEKGMELFGTDKELFIEQDQPKAKDIILSSSITEQKLFFNEREQKELTFLTNLLQPNNYDEVVNRLKSNNMKGNFTILFSGHAGTGKTESAYQIARSTGRDIKMVDISKTKSKWFGESEKLIMGIFSSYKRLVESSKLTPILLFNEADGIFSSRQTGEESSVRQTENSMQTCLLQAMEDFEGICICTTNLPLSLKEFERRFLYKITFDKPDSVTRFKILRDKIPFLTDDQIHQISEKYSLTGGQGANLSKKVIMQQILTGNYPDIDEIMRLCESEFLVKKGGRDAIGFKIWKNELQ